MPSDVEMRRIFDGVLDQFGSVTPTQRRILYLRVVRGYSRDEVARELIVSVKTIDSHLTQITLRLGYEADLPRLREDLFRAYARAEARFSIGS